MVENQHKHGEMDTTDQEKTFEGFITFTIKTVLVILALVILMALLNA
jgi:fumarate reductase subunit C